MVNFSTIELARRQQEAPTYIPFATGDLLSDPWMPFDPSFSRAHEQWGELQLAHNRPTDQTVSFQLFVLNYIRFILAGDLAGDWANFGGIAAQ